MPVITTIKPQKNQKRVNIYLDGKFGFGLDLENFVLLHLKLNQELTEKEVKDIKNKSDKAKTFNKALTFATLRPRSEKEVRDWFRRKKIEESEQANIFDKLHELNLLDDEKFAFWWVEQRQEFKPKPKSILKFELRIKGIKQEIIEKVLSENKVDEEKIAKDLVEKRMYKWEKLDKAIRKQKISQYLSSKGFNWEVIKKVLEIV